MKRFIYITCLLLFTYSCKTPTTKREIASDRIVHLEDSIHYTIPELPRLCDSLELVIRKVNIGDCRLYVEQEGKGTPMILINGGPGGTHHYFHPEFSSIKDRHTIIYYDQRGTGQSDFEAGKGYSFEQAVDDLEQLRKQLGISKWVVCGFSYGGGLAQFYTLKYPENVLGLVLISALPLFEDEGFQSEQEKYLSAFEKDKKNEIIKEFATGKLQMKPFLYNLALNGDWKRQRYYKPSRNEMIRSALYEWVNDKNFNKIMSKSYRSYNFRGLFDSCPVPTLIFEGKHDLTWGSKKATIFRANHPNAKFLLFERAGHMLYRDVPKQFFLELSNFTGSLKHPSQRSIQDWKESISNKLLD
ncbi:MAG: alpha/beta hydrolase [Bacteroidota bacterium]